MQGYAFLKISLQLNYFDHLEVKKSTKHEAGSKKKMKNICRWKTFKLVGQVLKVLMCPGGSLRQQQ